MIRPVAPVGGGPPARSPHTSFARSDRSRSPARPRRRPQTPQPGPINVARNSLATTSNFEITLLELQRFQRLLKLHPNELRAKFWKTVPQLIQQVARRHERPWPRGHPHRRPRQAVPTNVARNSLATTSNFKVTLLELQRFQRLLKLHPNELRAKFWKTMPQLIQQVARRHERPRLPADMKGRGLGPDGPGPRPRVRNVRCRRSPRRARDLRNAPHTRRRVRSRRSAHAHPGRASRTGNRCASPRC